MTYVWQSLSNLEVSWSEVPSHTTLGKAPHLPLEKKKSYATASCLGDCCGEALRKNLARYPLRWRSTNELMRFLHGYTKHAWLS